MKRITFQGKLAAVHTGQVNYGLKIHKEVYGSGINRLRTYVLITLKTVHGGKEWYDDIEIASRFALALKLVPISAGLPN